MAGARYPTWVAVTMNGTDLQEDLAFARACARGDAEALAGFESRFIPPLRKSLLQRGMDIATTEEALQLLRVKLFLPSGERPPRIADYGGQGSLLAWLRVAALRTALNLLRERKVAVGLDDSRLEEAVSPADEADRRYIKDRYRKDFTESFQEALKALEPRARTLLRLHLVDGLGTAEIARAYRVDRSTVKRWLAQSREWLRGEVRARLAARIGVDTPALGSLLHELQSQLDLSIRSAMREPTPG
ncbi:sigma-70 family RNA polymerase sigma factor [Myxococcus sp. RHSTA-1-4]|uniref:sigma-70 family RNA polymerase sigma factor n=1 Tax=Myxococcus sp. RHSTA-1-4 TaxID=2874601 RepID=UPI001CBE2870|nr:sigma-70 family RNA polymerase sigma factor [Myxococcus sp. RHSTA-1-4]MBZ4416484.1 sigma-70 family RNA polymerase sigma factor [Myxococcus sp. RHSTA-1-4]